LVPGKIVNMSSRAPLGRSDLRIGKQVLGNQVLGDQVLGKEFKPAAGSVNWFVFSF